jgi:hypothetical protein
MESYAIAFAAFVKSVQTKDAIYYGVSFDATDEHGVHIYYNGIYIQVFICTASLDAASMIHVANKDRHSDKRSLSFYIVR